MIARARRGLDAYLSRRTEPSREERTLIRIGSRALPLRVRRHPTARRLTLRLSQDGGEVRVTIPRWAPFREGIAFAEARRDWLAEQLAAIPTAQPVADGSRLPWRGESLLVAWNGESPRAPRIAEGTIRLGGPRETIAMRLRRWLESEALVLFEADLRDFCKAADCAVPPLRLSRARRRWGSCSAEGTLRINWRLAMAPDAVRRSVVAHEVAHLVHFDHSPAFHALLAQIFDGDLDAANGWLKREGPTLYAWFG